MIRRFCSHASIVLALFCPSIVALGQTWDAATDFSATSNPNGAWTYGWSQSVNSAFVLYQQTTDRGTGGILACWYDAALPHPPDPGVFRNESASPYSYLTLRFQPWQLAFHPGLDGEYSHVLWTAPSSGTFSIEVTFSGIDVIGTTTDVHVLRNGTAIFDGVVEGYGSNTAYTGTLALAQGDVVDFAVGYGSDGSYYCDSTGLAATITESSFVLTSVALTPDVLTGGNSGTGTVILSSAPASDTVVDLASSVPAKAVVPATVTVLAGQTTATFPITTTTVTTDTPVTIAATLNGVTQTANLLVTSTSLLSVTVSPTSVAGGKPSTGTVKLSKLAPAGGWLVGLSSENSAASVPAAVLVSAGFSSAKFTITTTLPDTTTTGNISASFGGTTKTTPLTVKTLTPVSLVLTPSTAYGGSNVSAKLTISAAAPAGGKTVPLTNTNAAATCPASVLVPAGKTSVTFTISTINPATTQTGDISATLGGVTVSALLTVNHSIATKITPDVLKALAGSSVTYGAKLIRSDNSTGLSGKTLSFYAGTTLLGTGSTDANGRATISTIAPATGVKQAITVKFAGDGLYKAASGVGSVTGL